MNANVSFSEILQAVKATTKKEIPLSLTGVDNKTVHIDYMAKIKVPIVGEVTKNISVSARIERIVGNTIYLGYDGGTIVDSLISNGLKMITNPRQPGVIELTNDSKVAIHLDRIEKLQKTLQLIRLKDIAFASNGIMAELAVR